MKKPRKPRAPKVATNDGVTYAWKRMMGTYVFNPVPGVSAKLEEAGTKWSMTVLINGHRFTGQRDTLEEAFKATDRLLFKHAKDYWLKSLCHEVLEPWVGTLEEA